MGEHWGLFGSDGIKATQGFPSGYLGDPLGRCLCTADQIARYRGRITGPLLWNNYTGAAHLA